MQIYPLTWPAGEAPRIRSTGKHSVSASPSRPRLLWSTYLTAPSSSVMTALPRCPPCGREALAHRFCKIAPCGCINSPPRWTRTFCSCTSLGKSWLRRASTRPPGR
jgi:hypothetical protein